MLQGKIFLLFLQLLSKMSWSKRNDSVKKPEQPEVENILQAGDSWLVGPVLEGRGKMKINPVTTQMPFG